MSAGWEIGDLLICVDDAPNKHGWSCSARRGHVYRLIRLTGVDTDGDLCCVVEGAVGRYPERGFKAYRFRKILPDKHEACEDEFVTLLNRIKQPVEAERSALFMGGK